MPKLLPEVFVSNAALAPEVSRKVKQGELRKLGTRVYTRNLKEKPEVLVRRYAWFLIEELFPGSLIADRTALEHRPAGDGSVFIISKKKRSVTLPGLSIHPRKGHGPLPNDKPFMGKLFLASPARAYLENMRPSRASKTRLSRTLPRQQIEEQLETLLQTAGEAALQALRDEAREMAKVLRAQKEFKALDSLIRPLLVPTSRGAQPPYDPKRLDLFQTLYEKLSTTPSIHRPAHKNARALPFFEAYFSNFIEGTEFEVEEALGIILEGKIPRGRPADAHDILGTYQIAADEEEMRTIPQTADELIALLRRRHASLMQGRPEMTPGQFKTVGNRVGTTIFVAPDLVQGTLRQGFKWLQALRTPFQRAVYMMFLVAEVHPFTDGNGRTARLMMNAELVAGNEMRIIIPTILRDSYLSALSALTNNGEPKPLIRVLDFAQDYTSRIDWKDYKAAQEMLVKTNAFVDSKRAEREGIHLKLM